MTKLNLGCGKDIKQGYVNLDMTAFKGVDKVWDLEKFPYPFEDNSFEEVYADNVIEHLSDVTKVMKELHRICKNSAVIHIKVPYYNSVGAYNDLTHKCFFNEYTFEPFYTKNHRSNYGITDFELIRMKLVPTIIGKFIPFEYVRRRMSIIFGEIIGSIDIKLRVVKK